MHPVDINPRQVDIPCCRAGDRASSVKLVCWGRLMLRAVVVALEAYEVASAFEEGVGIGR